MTLDELKQYSNEEFNNIEKVMQGLFSVYNAEKSGYTLAEKAAIGAFVINVYGGIENILKQVLIFDKLDIKDAPGWHEKVLRKSGEMGILPPDLFKLLSKYLAFRNYFIYAYIFNINWEDLKAMAGTIEEVIKRIRSEIDEYIQTI